jgi:lysophospholipase L1-like esterase
MDGLTQQALEIGRANAEEVISFRTKALRHRSQVLARRDAIFSQEIAMPAALAASNSAGALVAEGDSWFDYPWTDILRILEDEHGYDVHSAARAGDLVEQMAYSGGQLERFSRQLERLLRMGQTPRAILLSGGGNDLAGSEFGMLLDHAASASPGLNEQVVAGVIDRRIRLAYITILSAVTEVSREWIQKPVPILIHGYDYPVPDGRGFLGGWAFLPGPWLEPGFREKGFARMPVRKKLARELVDRFNAMLQGVAAMQEFSHVTHVDLRKTLSTGAKYRQYWENEMHPTVKGFHLVTDRFVSALNEL